MAHVTANRVLETTTTTGTGALTLIAAVTGFIRLSAAKQVDGSGNAIAVGDTVKYALWAVDASGIPTGDWENGLGTYSAANELTRTAFEESSTGSILTLAAGTKYVSISLLARDLMTNGRALALSNSAFSI